MKILFFTRSTWYSEIAKNFLKQNFDSIIICENEKDFLFKEEYFDYIIALGYQNILSAKLIKKARKAALNFHPGSTHNPGAGSYSYPLFLKQENSGVTCHYMDDTPDTGKVVMEKIFPIYVSDDFNSLKERTIIYLMQCFFEILDLIKNNNDLPESPEQWKRKPRSQKEFTRELLDLNINELNNKEIDLRIKSTNPNYPGPYIVIKNKKYSLRSI
ncbi:MAG: hypothetical protein CMD43_03345 [Gammaproteobacteria bacterium]|nr:hypothetical protein [Gammaproteobacteria bacterium]